MGFFDWFRGAPTHEGEAAFFVRDAAYARTLVMPREPAPDPEPPPICSDCERTMEQRLVTTRGDDLDPAIWDAAPVAVDAWLCSKCGVLRYPRRANAERITSFGRRAADLSGQGRFADAEWWLVRMVWAWPHYSPGWQDLAQARQLRAETEQGLEPGARQRTRRRATEAYETVLALETSHPSELAPMLIPAALLGLAEVAILDRAPERAARAIDECLARDDLDARVRARASFLQRFVAERR